MFNVCLFALPFVFLLYNIVFWPLVSMAGVPDSNLDLEL